MKKILLAMLIVFTMTNCSKDDDSASGFSQAEKEALQVLNGTFVCEETTITFTPFDSPTPKKRKLSDVPINFCGTKMCIRDRTRTVRKTYSNFTNC